MFQEQDDYPSAEENQQALKYLEDHSKRLGVSAGLIFPSGDTRFLDMDYAKSLVSTYEAQIAFLQGQGILSAI